MKPRGAGGWLTGASVSVRMVTDAAGDDAAGDDPGAVAAGEAVRRFDGDDTAGSTAGPTIEVALSFACGVGGVEVDDETRRAVEAATTSNCGSAEDSGGAADSGVSTRSAGAAASSEPGSVPDGSGVGSDSGSSAVPDPAEVVCAPSALRTAPVPGSAGADDSSDDEGPVAAVESSSDEAEFESSGDLGADVGLDAPVSPAEVEAGESDPPEDVELDVDSVSEGCASATGGVVTKATPTPSTMAIAPTHPP